jgi:hypothetical protein
LCDGAFTAPNHFIIIAWLYLICVILFSSLFLSAAAGPKQCKHNYEAGALAENSSKRCEVATVYHLIAIRITAANDAVFTTGGSSSASTAAATTTTPRFNLYNEVN